MAGSDDSFMFDEEKMESVEAEEIVPNWDPEKHVKFGDIVPKELLGKYSISTGVRSKHRCLHISGGCHRVPSRTSLSSVRDPRGPS